MKNIKKEANLKIKMKVTDIFKVIIIAFLVIAFTVSMISCKNEEQIEEQQEEEKGEVTVPSETKETTTKETPAVVEEEIVEEIDKISMVLQKVSPSVVNIEYETTAEYESSEGFASTSASGIVYTDNGYIITIRANLENIKKIKVTLPDGTQLPGNFVGEDKNTNIAVIKIDIQNLKSPNFTTKDVKVGEAVLSISRPFGKDLNFSQGFVLGTGINMTISPDTLPLVDLVKTDTEGKPGVGGGPLVNMDGSIIGVNLIMIPSVDGEGFSLLALPSDIATNISDQIIKYGSVKIPSIGIEMGHNDTDVLGVYVAKVVENSPAIKAGIEAGDIIVEFDGVEIKDQFQLFGQILRKNVGDLIQLKIFRDRDYITLSVELGESEQS